jgi:hypothetical protein
MGAAHTTPTARRSEVAGSAGSKAGVLTVLWTEGRAYQSEESALADLLMDETWCNTRKVAFLADISQALNILNKSMQF